MKKILNASVSRRGVLAGSLAGAGMLAMPSILKAQDKSLKVGVYGGYFKDSFDKNIFPEFTKATGIAVESIAEPTGEAWLVQLEQAAGTLEVSDVQDINRLLTVDAEAQLAPSSNQ